MPRISPGFRRSFVRCLFAAGLFPIACGGGSNSAAHIGAAAIPLLATPAATQTLVAPQSPLPPLPSGSTAQPAVPPPSGIAATVLAPVDTTPVPVHLSIVLPTNGAARIPTGRIRRPEYISSANTLISVTVTPLGGSSTVYGPSACTSGSCAINFTATPGPNTLSFSLTDGSSNVLSQFSNLTVIQPSTVNTLRFSANPVVQSVSLSLSASTVTAGIPADAILSVAAKDASGNTIVGSDQYVDANGNPLSLALDITNNQAGGAGRVTLTGSNRLTAPGQAPIVVHYNGRWLDNAVISVSSSRPVAGSLSGITLSTIPHAFEYTISGSPVGLVTGPDGNIWYNGFNGGTIGKISYAGTNWMSYSCGTGCTLPHYIINGPDGNLWFSEYGSGFLTKFSTGGTPTRLTATSFQPFNLVLGPDGNVWYSCEVGAAIGKVSAQGTKVEYASPGGHRIRGINFGPDGNLWYLDNTSNLVGRLSRSGKYLSTSATASLTTSDVILPASDGNMWFVASGGSVIERVTMNGVVTPFSPTTLNTQPRGLTVGPDGNFWFTETNVNKIGRMSISGAMLGEYDTANGIDGASTPIGIMLGADGNIWFTEYGANKITKFVL